MKKWKFTSTALLARESGSQVKRARIHRAANAIFAPAAPMGGCILFPSHSHLPSPWKPVKIRCRNRLPGVWLGWHFLPQYQSRSRRGSRMCCCGKSLARGLLLSSSASMWKCVCFGSREPPAPKDWLTPSICSRKVQFFAHSASFSVNKRDAHRSPFITYQEGIRIENIAELIVRRRT